MALVLGAADAWIARFTMVPDGVSYLDIGDAYWRGDWQTAINAYWSPLYSWIVGFFLKVLKPSPYWEYPAVHLVNFLIFAAALASFEFFLVTFIAERKRQDHEPFNRGMGLQEPSWWLLGYSVFISCSIVLIGLRRVTPDLCVTIFVCLASALVLKIQSGLATLRTYVALGVVLGLAYLAKAVMFPLGFVFLVTATLAGGLSKNSLRNVAVATLAFLTVAGPFIAAISHAKGRPTFGDSGKINYAICVQGDDWYIPTARTLQHPVRKLLEFPVSYQFQNPIAGTYPPWYDPSYWHEGVKTHFNLKREMEALLQGLQRYQLIYLNTFLQLNISLALLILFALAPSFRFMRRLSTAWAVWIPALIALLLYALVVVEFRYVGPFVLLLWIVGFCGPELPANEGDRLVFAVLKGLFATTVFLALFWMHASYEPNAANYSSALMSLENLRLEPGDQLAVIGKEVSGRDGTFIARLGRMQVVAEVDQPDEFWKADPRSRSLILDALANSGAKAVLTYTPSGHASGWKKLGNTDYFAKILVPRTDNPTTSGEPGPTAPAIPSGP